MPSQSISANIFDFNNWQQKLPQLTTTYNQAEPFPHIVLENFLSSEVLSQCADEFTALNNEGGWINYIHYNEKKRGLNKIDALPATIRSTIEQLNSPEFLQFLSKLTGINNLQADPMLEGGGVHQSGKGGFLNIHADFTAHPHNRNLRRRLNLLVYLNKDWNPDWGGQLELWDKNMTACVHKVTPLFNRAVIFTTDANSYHGHPEPMTCPDGVYRRSIALYYYTKEDNPLRQATLYKARPEDKGKSLFIKLDNLLVAGYTRIKSALGSNDKVISSVLNIFRKK